MTISLPPTTHPARQLFDMPSLVDTLAPAARPFLPTLRSILFAASTFTWTGIQARHFVCVKVDGSIVLERIGPKGGHKTVWTFYRPA